jgi:hypothetical protein
MKISRTMPILLFLLLLKAGCSSYNDSLSNHRDRITSSETIYKVEKKDGSFVLFSQDTLSRARIRDSVIIGMQTDGSLISVPIQNVKRIYTKQPSVTATIVNVGIVTVFIGSFVYAFSHLNGGLVSGPLFHGPL